MGNFPVNTTVYGIYPFSFLCTEMLGAHYLLSNKVEISNSTHTLLVLSLQVPCCFYCSYTPIHFIFILSLEGFQSINFVAKARDYRDFTGSPLPILKFPSLAKCTIVHSGAVMGFTTQIDYSLLCHRRILHLFKLNLAVPDIQGRYEVPDALFSLKYLKIILK